MRGVSGRVVVLLVLAVAIAAGDASARAIRRLCRDGVIANRTDRSGRLTMSCDVDHQCDGICSFELPVCDAATCQTQTFAVPVRSARPERMALTPGAAPVKLVLRCRPTPRSVLCIAPATTSTTTMAGGGGGGGHLPRQTTTTQGAIVASTTSTTSTITTTSTSCTFASTTTTSLVPVPCQGDFDCDGFSSACAIGFCGFDELCKQTCFCLRPDGERTCVLDEALPCLTPADCPRLIGDRCHLCYLNRCVTAPAPVPGCF